MNSSLLLENFESLLGGDNSIKKLQDIILQLAIQGKLITDNTTHVSVDTLLKNIKTERSALEKQKKIRKVRLSTVNLDDEVLYRLPNNWKWVKIGQVGNVFNGNSISKSEKEKRYTGLNDGYNYVATKDIDFISRAISYENGIKIPFEEEKFKIAHKDAILICAEGGSAGKKIALTEQDICFGNKLYATEAFSGILPEYLFYVYQSPFFFNQFSNEMTGIIGGISINKFIDLYIPLPPSEEQKHIVKKIKELFTLLKELKHQKEHRIQLKKQTVKSSLNYLEKTSELPKFINDNFDTFFNDVKSINDLRSTILHLAATGRLSRNKQFIDSSSIWKQLPKNWMVPKLESLISFGPQNGYSPKPVSYTTPIKSLTLSATTSGKFDETKFKYIDEEIPENSHLWLNPLDILIQRGNSPEYVGVSAIYEGKANEFIYPDLMIKIRVNADINPKYLHIVLLSPQVRKFFLSHATGTSGSMPKINQKTVKKCPIPLPPSLKTQELIVSHVKRLMALCDELEDKILQSKILNNNSMDAIIYHVMKSA